LSADGILLCGELQMPLVDRQLGRACQRHTAVGAGDVPVLMQSTEVASHGGERDAESLGDFPPRSVNRIRRCEVVPEILPLAAARRGTSRRRATMSSAVSPAVAGFGTVLPTFVNDTIMRVYGYQFECACNFDT